MEQHLGVGSKAAVNTSVTDTQAPKCFLWLKVLEKMNVVRVWRRTKVSEHTDIKSKKARALVSWSPKLSHFFLSGPRFSHLTIEERIGLGQLMGKHFTTARLAMSTPAP